MTGLDVLPVQAKAIRVLIVDDSALVRRLLTEMLSSDPLIEVLGTAADAFAARKKIKLLNPDVITLDVEMPGMSGLQFLRNLMRLRPLPVVMVSSLTARGAEVTLTALEIGAVDYVCKPRVDLANSLRAYSDEIITKVKVASTARVRHLPRPLATVPVREKESPGAPLASRQLVAIGASTGGTEAVRKVLSGLTSDSPGTVLVQHISKAFSRRFVERLNEMVSVDVREATDDEVIRYGRVYVAPGDRHLAVGRRGQDYYCRLLDDEPLNFHRPAIDRLFRSVAQTAGEDAVGVILTGMGTDGAEGMAEMRRAGARTIAQDRKTSVIWGMPSAAIKRKAVVAISPLEKIGAKINSFLAAVRSGDKQV